LASTDQKDLVNGLLMQALCSNLEDDAAMREAMFQIAKGALKGMLYDVPKGAIQRAMSWGRLEAPAEIICSTVKLVEKVSELVSYLDPTLPLLLFTPVGRCWLRETKKECIESVEKTLTAIKGITPDNCFEAFGSMLADYAALRAISTVINVVSPKISGLPKKIGRNAVYTGDMIEDLYANGYKTIRDADSLPLDQLPTLNPKLSMPKDKQQIKALLVEDNQIARKHIEEVIIGKTAESQGAIKGPITRPVKIGKQASLEIDFLTAGPNVENIDIKSFRAVYNKPDAFELVESIANIQKGIAKGETILLNMAHLNKKHLRLFMKEIVTNIDIQDRSHKIIIALSDKNMLSLASERLVLEQCGNLNFINVDLNTPASRLATALLAPPKLGDEELSCVEADNSALNQTSRKNTNNFNPTTPPPSLPYFKKQILRRTLSQYTGLPQIDLNVPKLRLLYEEDRTKIAAEAFSNLKIGPNFLSLKDQITMKDNEMLALVDKIISANSENPQPRNCGVAIRSESHPEYRKQVQRRAKENLDTMVWEQAWSWSPEIRAYSDKRINLLLDCLFGSLEDLSPKSVNARLNLIHMSFPGGLIKEDLVKFKHDLMPCFFESNGNLRLEADIEMATSLTAEFLRSISKDKEYFETYLKHAQKRKKVPILCDLMEKELVSTEVFKYRKYEPKHETGWDSFKDMIGVGNLGLAEYAAKSSFNQDMQKLIEPSTKFADARSIIKKYRRGPRMFLKKIFSDTHLSTYTKYGVLKNYENDTHYKNLTPEELKETRENQADIDMLNTALWIRSKVGSSVREQFNIGSSASSATLRIVDRMVNQITVGGADPLSELMESEEDSSKEVLSSFFDEEGVLKNIGREKRLSIISNKSLVPAGSTIPDKFVNLFYQLGSKIQDAEVRQQIFKYLIKHPDADEVLQHNYQKIGRNAFSVCIKFVDGVRNLKKLKNLDFTGKFTDSKQISNHHSLAFLAAEFFEALNACGGQKQGILPKKYLILSCIDSLSTLMFANNRIENAEKVDSKIREIFDDFNLPVELYHSKQNVECLSWLPDCLNSLKADQLEKLILKYDKI